MLLNVFLDMIGLLLMFNDAFTILNAFTLTDFVSYSPCSLTLFTPK